MRKTTVIKGLLSLSLFYIILQLFSIKNLFKGKSVESGNGQSKNLQSEALLYHTIIYGCVKRNRKSPKILHSENIGQDLVFDLTVRCDQKEIPVFVIEPAVLRSVVSVSDVNSKVQCLHLCATGAVLSLGVFAADWDKKGFLLKDLRNHDIAVIEVTSPDPRKLTTGETTVPSIPTHYFLHQVGSLRPLIHLVVFYKRADNFLWYSQLHTSNKTENVNLKTSDLTFGNHAGAFDRFPVRKVRVDGMWLSLPHTVKEFLTQVPQSTFIECDYKKAQTFLNKYPQDNSDDAQQFQRKARQLLSRGKEILDELGVRFWLSSGTCLGWFRQCGIITYSKDIDFGIWIKDYQEDIVSAFEGRGFSLKKVFGKESDSYQLAFKAGDIKIDLFFFYEEGSYMWNGGTDALTGHKYKYYFPRFSVCWTLFLDLRVRVPCPVLPYITANYGQNWNTPVKQWNWKKSPANVKENGVWPKEQWDTVIQVYE